MPRWNIVTVDAFVSSMKIRFACVDLGLAKPPEMVFKSLPPLDLPQKGLSAYSKKNVLNINLTVLYIQTFK